MFKCFFKEAFVFNRNVSFLSLKGFDKPRGHIKRIFFLFYFFYLSPKRKAESNAGLSDYNYHCHFLLLVCFLCG